MTTTTSSALTHWSDTFGLPVAISGRGATTERRSIERRYAITGLERYSERERGLVTPALTVSAIHDKDRKRYLLVVDRVLITPLGFRAVIDYGQTKTDEIKALSYSVWAARYSKATLQQVHVEHLATIEKHLPMLLDWARGADEGE